MTQLDFADIRTDIVDCLEATRSEFEGLDLPAEASDRLDRAREVLDSDGRLQIALLGEYNAGKSSLVRALTGAEVGIDADVETTEPEAYHWNGVDLIDTPGVQSQSTEIDHDRMARETTIDADLVIFVLTASGFNDRLASCFEHVVGPEGLGLASKTFVVVNKMDQTSAPDEHVLGDIRRAMHPHDDLPVQPAAVRDWLEASSVEGEVGTRLRQRSRMSTLFDRLDTFVDRRGALGRLTRPLQHLERAIDAAREDLSGDDEAVKRRFEYLRRRRHTVERAIAELDEKKSVWTSRIRLGVREDLEGVVGSIDETTSREELEALVDEQMRRARSRLESLRHEIVGDLRAWVSDLRDDLTDIDESPLGRALLEPDESADAAVEAPDFEDSPSHLGDPVRMARKLTDDGLDRFLQKAAASPDALRDTIYQTGKKLGYKFDPWEAVKAGEKLSDVLGKISKAMPVISLGLEIWASYREEREADEREKRLAEARMKVREAFGEMADERADAMGATVDRFREEMLEPVVDSIDEEMEALTRRESNRDAAVGRLGELNRRSRRLRSRIMNDARARGDEVE
jgi:tRNA U34 5-carboxymethylaminomethyl modifying GTPase MnmE/TrmE